MEQNYDTGMRYLAYLRTRLTPEGFVNHGLGDWGNPEGQLSRENIETAFLYADAITLSRFARLLGREDDERSLCAFADALRENYNEKLLTYSRELGAWCYRAWDHPGETVLTQAGQALPLYWGMVPPDKRSDVERAFRHTLEEKGAFVSGEVGLPYILQTARRCGLNELIFRFITRETHPSYYAFVLDGETTLGEYWESNPRSHCHDMMGHIIEWYYNGMAGIQPKAPGFAKVSVAPWLPEGMESFSCRYETPHGVISVTAGRDEGGAPRFAISVPEGVELVEENEDFAL